MKIHGYKKNTFCLSVMRQGWHSWAGPSGKFNKSVYGNYKIFHHIVKAGDYQASQGKKDNLLSLSESKDCVKGENVHEEVDILSRDVVILWTP